MNGANHRFFHLELADGPPFHQIGSDGGMFDAPVAREQLLMGPADRADVIVDFAGFEGKKLVLRNVELPAGVVSAPAVNLPEIMLFRVLGAGTTGNSPGPATIPTSLPGSLPSFGQPQRERYLTLEFAGGRFLIDGRRFHDPVNIQVPEGDVEDWLLINLTGGTHPIHVHLVEFQIVSRRPFNVAAYRAALTAARANDEPNPDPAPYYTGGPLLPQTNDVGFKDNVFANPGVVTPSTWVAARIAQHIAVRPLIPDADTPWLEERRRDLEGTYLRALELAAQASLRIGGGELNTAERTARALIRLAPFRESGYRYLMETLAACGNAAEALNVYETLRTLLRDELGAAPSPATQDLHRALLR